MVRICPGVDYLIVNRGVKRVKIGRRIAKRVGFVHDTADGNCFHKVSPNPGRRAFTFHKVGIYREITISKKVLDISVTIMVSYFIL